MINKTDINHQKSIRRIVSIILLFSLMLTLTACRESPVLQQRVYTQNAEIDPDQQNHDNDQDHEIEDMDISSKKEQDQADRKTEFDYSKPTEGTNTAPVDSSKDMNDNSNQDNDDSSEDQPAGEQQDLVKPTSDDRVLRQIVDASGKQVEIPVDVDTVTAVGDVALYVEMLGGDDRLLASSESFTQNTYAKTVFGASEVSDVSTLWTKRGTTAMTDVNFKKLLKLDPDVCFIVSGDTTFTDAQIKELGEWYISVVTLPKLGTTKDIQKAIDIIAEVLGDKSAETGKKNAPSVASQYKDWMDRILSSVEEKDHVFGGANKIDFDVAYKKGYTQNDDCADTGSYTLFISDWDETAHYTVGTDAYVIFEGTGMAVARTGYSTSPLTYYLSLGGACNTAAIARNVFSEQDLHVTTLFPTSFSITNSGYKKWDLWNDYKEDFTKTTDNATRIGSSSFNKIIVASKDIKNRIDAEINASGYSLWKNYGFQNVNGTTGYGFIYNNTIVYSNMQGACETVVNPSGVGSWTTGSPESPLEAMWASNIFSGDYDLTAIKSEISAFYETFYGYKPTDSVLTSILSGAEK